MNTDLDMTQWAQSRETDLQVAEAIFYLAKDIHEADRIWDEPTREEWLAIWERVTGNGREDGNNFQWGESPLGNEYDLPR